MPTNANIFNSRVTSEALEAKFRQVFPSQGGAELPQDLFASGVIQPVVDFSSVAEGSILPENLQTAWDFATGSNTVTGSSTTTIINNTGFWQFDVTWSGNGAGIRSAIQIYDGATAKNVWKADANGDPNVTFEDRAVLFLRAGDIARVSQTGGVLNVWYRQIADVNGTLVNPLGFTFS